MADLPRAVPPDLNLLLVTIDTLRADHLGCYGYPRPTSPAIDALAAEGALFENGWAHAPSTRYSMPAIAAGRWPSAITWDESIWWPRLGPDVRTTAQALHDAGYFTGGDVQLQLLRARRPPRVRARHGRIPRRARGAARRRQRADGVARLVVARDHRRRDRVRRRPPRPEVLPLDPLLRSAPLVRDAPGGAAVRTDARRSLRRRDPLHRSAPRAADRAPAGGWACGIARPSSSPAITAKGSASTASPSTASTSTRRRRKVPFIVRVPGLAPRRVRAPVGHIDIAPTLLNLARGRRRAGVHRPFAGPRRRRAAGGRHRHAGRVPGGDLGAREEARPRDHDAAPDLERGARATRPSATTARAIRPRRTTSGSRRRRRGRPARARPLARDAQAPGRRAGAAARRGRRSSRQAVTPPGGRPAPRRRTRSRRRSATRSLVRGYDLAPTRCAAGGTLDVTYHFAVRQAAAGRAGGCSSTWRGRPAIRNLDHVPVDGLMPLERWRPGQQLRDRQRIRDPAGHAAGHLHALPRRLPRRRERLPVTPAALSDGRDRLRLLIVRRVDAVIVSRDAVEIARSRG